MILRMAIDRGLKGRDRLLLHIERTGQTIAGDIVWTARELAAIPHRTNVAIAHKARQLGLVPTLRIWSDADTVRLRRRYVTGTPIQTLTQMFDGKTPKQIWSKASHMRYRRPRCPPKLTGHPLIDSLRRRAYDLRITMAELDAFVGRKRYFAGVRHIGLC